MTPKILCQKSTLKVISNSEDKKKFEEMEKIVDFVKVAQPNRPNKRISKDFNKKCKSGRFLNIISNKRTEGKSNFRWCHTDLQ